MKRTCALFILFGLVGCSTLSTKQGATFDKINAELKHAAAQPTKVVRPQAVDQALLPPLRAQLPKPRRRPLERRFDLVVNNASAAQVFMAIVSGTPYNMLLAPGMSGTISIALKDVTVREALDTIRELYGYDYHIDGNRIFVEPLTLQTRVFKINYLADRRQGTSDVRVSSSSISTSTPANGTGTNNSTSGAAAGAAAQNNTPDSSSIYTTSDTDFWKELQSSLRTIIGTEGGRQVVLNPMSGVIVVRAYPKELRSVERFLRETQLIVEREVMLEAKIIEVQLNDGYESGINWAGFDSTGALRGAVGADTRNINFDGSLGSSTSPATLGNTLGGGMVSSTGRTDTGLFGLAFRTGSFTALLQYLQTQGNVQVLSSPRIATLNNQKAVLKVGTDEFFITNVSTTTTNSGTSSTVSPTITVQPFFSGIALDVTPQIDANNDIILHVHPSVSDVAEVTKNVNLGTLGTFTLPLAASAIDETDSIVRVSDGSIVAIGGLMKQSQFDKHSGVPVASDVPILGALFGQKSKGSTKSELVVLIKPTIIRNAQSWHRDLVDTEQRVRGYDPRVQMPDKWPQQ